LAKDNLTRGDKNMLLLATDIEGNTAWHLTAMWGEVHVLQNIWGLAKNNVTTEEIK
jgi:hypothetical protein